MMGVDVAWEQSVEADAREMQKRIEELEAENAELRKEFAEMLYDWLDGIAITDEQAEYARTRIGEVEKGK